MFDEQDHSAQQDYPDHQPDTDDPDTDEGDGLTEVE